MNSKYDIKVSMHKNFANVYISIIYLNILKIVLKIITDKKKENFFQTYK